MGGEQRELRNQGGSGAGTQREVGLRERPSERHKRVPTGAFLRVKERVGKPPSRRAAHR